MKKIQCPYMVLRSCRYFYHQIKALLLCGYTVNKYTIHIHCISGSHPDQLYLFVLVSLVLIINSIVLFPCSTSPWLYEGPGFPFTILHWPGQIRRVALIMLLTNSFPLSLCKTVGKPNMLSTFSTKPLETFFAHLLISGKRQWNFLKWSTTWHIYLYRGPVLSAYQSSPPKKGNNFLFTKSCLSSILENSVRHPFLLLLLLSYSL